jgi:hypothetical protein
MIRRFAAFSVLLALSSPAVAQPEEPSPEERVARWASPELVRFRSEAEFRRYLRDLYEAGRGGGPPPPAIMPAPIAAPSPGPSAGSPAPVTVVSGASLSQAGSAPANPSITNVQEAGVDEGDIVKQVGRFLLVLQDGRIFSIDTEAPGGGLALADRIDVYAATDDDAWYDEMLVFGDRVIVTGYSYDQEASQFTVLRVSPEGRVSHQGTFLLSSNDYYDEDNYATRLIGDRLIIYTPIFLSDIDLDEKWEWPAVRRWRREDDRETPPRGRPVLDARSIYRPVADWEDPVIHTVSICRLGDASAASGDPPCESRAFVGPYESQMYVTPTDAWLWTSSGADDWESRPIDCAAGARPAVQDTVAAFLYRLPLRGGRVRVAGVRGEPVDQLSMAVIGDRFHALTRSYSTACNVRGPAALTFATVPLSELRRRLREVSPSAYTPLPSAGDGQIENRFTDNHLVYGGRTSWSSYPPEEGEPEHGRVGVVPVARPSAVRQLPIPHSVIRAERVGNDAIVTGYSDSSGLQLSIVDLDGAPRIASTTRLDGRYESEGRSHAFNAAIGGDGSGVLGIPTVTGVRESGRWVWRSGASDISYLALDPSGRLAPLGELVRGSEADSDGYRCEVSCVDWYGNSRPIFTGGRVFALIGKELVEGRVESGRVRELRRLDLTRTPERR